MTIKEAEEYLNLTQKNYDLQKARKQYANLLLHKYHPDNKNDIPEEKKEFMSRKITEAYRVIKRNFENKKSLDTIIDLPNELERDYNREKEIHNLNMDNVPSEIEYKIKEYYQKYIILYQNIKFKLHDPTYHSIEDVIINKYKEEYYQYRSKITYLFLNYLENGVQKEEGSKSSLHSKIFFEYCEKYESDVPYILNSMYEIVQKFISFLPIYIEEQQRIKTFLKKKAIEEITKKMEEYKKNEHYPMVKSEIDNILDFSLQQIELIFEVSPIKKVKRVGEIEKIVQTFINMTEEIMRKYNQFLLRKEIIIDNWKDYINQEIENDLTKTELLLKIFPLYEESNMERFYTEIDNISQILTTVNNKDENNQSSKRLIFKIEDD